MNTNYGKGKMPDVDVPCQNFDKCGSMEPRSVAVLKGMLKTGKKVICYKCSEERHVILSHYARMNTIKWPKSKIMK